MNLKQHIRDIPDFPKPGILFRDITPLLYHQESFRYCVDAFAKKSEIISPDVIVGIESRGFIFGSALAYEMQLPFVPIRKEGKLPYSVREVKYDLEYGSGILQIHSDVIKPSQRVVLVDDLVATGGTIQASRALIEELGGVVVGINTVVILKDLCIPELLDDEILFSLIDF
jgi:adenine phosphoribosyltransferase